MFNTKLDIDLRLVVLNLFIARYSKSLPVDIDSLPRIRKPVLLRQPPHGVEFLKAVEFWDQHFDTVGFRQGLSWLLLRHEQ